MGEFPCLMEWLERIAEREAVRRGIGEKYETNVEVGIQAGKGRHSYETGAVVLFAKHFWHLGELKGIFE